MNLTNTYTKEDHLLNKLEFTRCCNAIVDTDETCPVCGKKINYESKRIF